MRRDMRKNESRVNDFNDKIIKYSGIGIAVLAVIVFALLIYSKKLNDEVRGDELSGQQLSSILNSTNSSENTESASTEIGKSINQVSNEIEETKNNTVTKKSTNSSNSTKPLNTTSKNNETTSSTSQNVLTTNNVTATNSNVTEQENKEPSQTTAELTFVKPVDGDIVRDFAIENLIYSDTLQEWTTHTGIDIKADKTTVVKSAEAGTVKTIKNDPRYGLTVIIEHSNGFQTVYSNLLTSEFVVEGEKVEKGQSLGTVGNTAAFEISDEPHLHFEILKDSVQVDPNIYLK